MFAFGSWTKSKEKLPDGVDWVERRSAIAVLGIFVLVAAAGARLLMDAKARKRLAAARARARRARLHRRARGSLVDDDREGGVLSAVARLTNLLPAGGNSARTGNRFLDMSALAFDLRGTAGYLVADARGRIVGKVECPMYGTSPETPDALSVRSGFLARRRRLVPAETIEQIDGGTRIIGLRIDRDSIRTFL